MELFRLRSAQSKTAYLCVTLNMRQFSGILLAVLITLLLGLSPLQGAIANFSGSLDQREDAHQIADAFDGGMAVSYDFAVIQDCEQSSVDGGCFSHSGSTGQCATCALALPPIALHPTISNITPGMLRADEDIVRQLGTSLYRPPKI